MLRNKRGFTLIEVIVVAAIIAILAGILVPMIFSQIDESNKTKAMGDCKAVQTAILAFRKDTGVWPNRTAPNVANVTMLTGSGTVFPAASFTAMQFDSSQSSLLINHLYVDDNVAYGNKWKGPYFSTLEADPWGNSYFINAKNFDDNNPSTPVWILSAGPDGLINTLSNSETIQGDDIGVRIK